MSYRIFVRKRKLFKIRGAPLMVAVILFIDRLLDMYIGWIVNDVYYRWQWIMTLFYFLLLQRVFFFRVLMPGQWGTGRTREAYMPYNSFHNASIKAVI